MTAPVGGGEGKVLKTEHCSGGGGRGGFGDDLERGTKAKRVIIGSAQGRMCDRHGETVGRRIAEMLLIVVTLWGVDELLGVRTSGGG